MRCVASEGARRRFRREHGFQLPLHPLQVSGWLALTALSAASYLLLVPGLPHHFQVNKPVVIPRNLGLTCKTPQVPMRGANIVTVFVCL